MSDERRAIEALRAGVPNRAAIRLLGSTATAISDRFQSDLHRCRAGLATGTATRGQIVSGGFGTGKSHLLGYLRELALQDEFVVSVVSISKETPLFDADRLFVAAMRNGAVPRRNDDVMTAVLSRLKPNTESFDLLEQWTMSAAAALSPLFPALLHLIPRPETTPERLAQIGRFLAGNRLSQATVRQWLSEAGARRMFTLKPVKPAELARQRLRFAPRLMAAAGFGGWCVLLDEVELVGRYSVLQRGRSYAELARWLSLDAEAGVPGIIALAAVTDDFAANVISAKRDDELAAPRLTAKGERETAHLASTGIRALVNPGAVAILPSPDDAMLRQSLEHTRRLYGKAYDWQPPSIDIGDQFEKKSMRQYIKSWITVWDLQRLYGASTDIVAGTIATDYAENTDMEAPTEPNGDETDPAA
jgi:hypothetical protein